MLLVNNDVLVGDHALDRLAETVARQPEAGVVGVFTEMNTMSAAAFGGTPLAAGRCWRLPSGLGH